MHQGRGADSRFRVLRLFRRTSQKIQHTRSLAQNGLGASGESDATRSLKRGDRDVLAEALNSGAARIKPKG
jgi:hypothetical protein